MSQANIEPKILEQIKREGVSVVMGGRNEFPQVAMTINNLMEDFYNHGIENYEVILMDNGSEDETSRFFTWRPIEKGGWTKYQRAERGMVAEGKLRIYFDPILSNVGTRNKGTRLAKYENIVFSDAHMIVRSGAIPYMLETLIKNKGGIVHAPIAWMGASVERPNPGMQYTYKVGEKIWGTWNKVAVSETEPYYIPFCGHAFIAVRRKQFLKYRGYPEDQRVYGGGEPYLDTKYWMLGSHSMMDPRALTYHLSSGRGYNWHNNDNIHNMFLVSYILGGEKWSDRILMTYYNNPGASKHIVKMLHDEAIEEGKEDKAWLDKHKQKTFEEVVGLDHEDDIIKMTKEEKSKIKASWWCTTCTKRGYPDPHIMRPWDIKNQEQLGKHRSFVGYFALTEKDGKYYIGNTLLKDPDAITLAKKYI